MTPGKLQETLDRFKLPISLETPIGDDEESVLGDLVPDKTFHQESAAVESSQLVAQLNDVFQKYLTPREQQVLKGRFGLEDGQIKTYRRLADELELSHERVRQIEDDALRKLRRPHVRMRQRFQDVLSTDKRKIN